MANTSLLSVRIDPKTKKAAMKEAERLGLSLSVMVKNYVRGVAREIHFNLSEVPNKKTAATLRRMDKDITAGKNMIGPFGNADEFIKSLRS